MNAAEKAWRSCDLVRRDGLIVTNQISVCKELDQTTNYIIYVICRMGSPKTEYFILQIYPKPVNNFFPQSLKSPLIYNLHIARALAWPWAEIGKSGPCWEPIRLQDSLQCPLQKKKKKPGIIYDFWTQLPLLDYLSITTAYSYAYEITWGFRRFSKRE